MLREFKEFIMRGNVLDLAVAVIIGAAFNQIVKSLVDDIIMPVIGAIFGKVDFTNLFLPLAGEVTATTLAEAKKQGVVLAWGNFLTVTVNFIIVAFAIFLVIKLANRFRRKEEEKPAEPPKPSREEELLAEIRDLLRQQAERA
jgi:large conductance mechanosensitive channel